MFCICCLADISCCVCCFFSFHYEMTTKAKFIFLPKEHEGGLDKDGGEAGEVSSLNQPQKRHEPTMMSVVTK